MDDKESKDLESYIKNDEMNETSEEDTSLLIGDNSSIDDNSSLLDENEANTKNDNQDRLTTDDTAEANASLLTGDPDPFNKNNFGELKNTLNKIEDKIDKETEQLKKLDVLDDIKTEIQKMNDNSLMQSTSSSPSTGHNLPSTDDLLNRVEELENKIQNNSGDGVSDEIQTSINELLNNVQKLNAATNTYNKRFEKLEETISRFEEMEKDIHLEYVDDEEKIDISNKSLTDKNKKRQNILYLILIVLIMTLTGLVILDRLKIIDLYLDSIFKMFFY